MSAQTDVSRTTISLPSKLQSDEPTDTKVQLPPNARVDTDSEAAIGPPTETRHPSPLTFAAISTLMRDAKSFGKPAGETIAIRVIESRMRVHQPVHCRGHFAFEKFLGGVG